MIGVIQKYQRVVEKHAHAFWKTQKHIHIPYSVRIQTKISTASKPNLYLLTRQAQGLRYY